jgi:hypothetical protein
MEGRGRERFAGGGIIDSIVMIWTAREAVYRGASLAAPWNLRNTDS